MTHLFKPNNGRYITQPPGQAPQRVRRVTIASQARALISEVGQNYAVDNTGRYIAIFHLLGSDVGVVDEQTLAAHLKVLEQYLERTPGPIQHISASYPQPLDPYLAYLEACYNAASKHIPYLATPLQELAEHLVTTSEGIQARLGADYWVVTYYPRGSARQLLGGGKPPVAPTGQAQANGFLGRWQRAQQAASQRAIRELEEHCSLLSLALKRAEIKAERLQGKAFADIFASNWSGDFTPFLDDAQEDSAALSQEALSDSVRKPTGLMELTSSWACTSGGYVRSWYLRDFIGLISPGIVNWLAQQPGVRVLQYCEQVPMAEARRVLRLNRTIAASERYLRPQGDIPDFDWMVKTQSNDETRQALSFRNEPVFRYRAIIQQWAESEEELEERTRGLLLSMQDRSQIVVHQATFRQDDALVSGLPLGQCRIEKPERNMDAKGLARLLYPSPRDPLQPTGVWLGAALPGKLMVTMDLFALQNPVVELVGIMGSGKSMTQKFLLTQLVAQGFPGFVLDGAREYISTVEALKGTVIRLGSVHGPGFNPVHFDPLDESEEGDPFVVGQALFLDWIEAALHSLSDIEKTIAGEAYLRALEHTGILRSERDTWEKPRPLLSDVYASLLEEPGDPAMGYDNPQIVARRLAIALKPFALGVYAPIFNRHDQLVLGNERLVCFDVYDVPDRLRLAFVHQLLAFIQRQTLRRYRYKGSVLVLDEGHLLLHDERSARIIEHLVRNGRKAAQLMLFTQHTHTDSQRNTSAQLAHKTAGATLVFRINRQDVATLDDLHLSPLEKEIVVEQNEGECLLVSPSGHMRLKVLIPPAWYPRFTTKPGEVLAQQAQPAEEPEEELPSVTVEPVEEPPAEQAVPDQPLPVLIPPLVTPAVAPDLTGTRGQIDWEAALIRKQWEETLVGANQVAPEWLGLAASDHSGTQQPTNLAQPGPQQPDYLRLVWSRDAPEPAAGE